MRKILFSTLMASALFANAQVKTFSQNFNANTWEGAGANQLTKSVEEDATVTYDATNGGILLKRSSLSNITNVGNATVGATGTGATGLTVVKFNVYATANTRNSATALWVAIGTGFNLSAASVDGFPNNGTAQSNSYALLALSYTTTQGFAAATTGRQTVVGGGSGATSSYVSAPDGKATINWVVNKSGASKTYTGLDNQTYTIAADTWQAWIGNTLATFGTNTSVRVWNNTIPTIGDIKVSLANAGSSLEWGVDNLEVWNMNNNQMLSTLPVTFSQLSAKLSGSSVLVNWTTASEQNNDYFEIEGSTDGKTFKTLKKVASKNGNSSTVQEYQESVSISDIAALLAIPALLGFVGFSPLSRRRKLVTLALAGVVAASTFAACQKEGKDVLAGQNGTSANIQSGEKPVYIRIKQVDKDGEFTYSDTVVASK